ncbi:SusD/RagB family nutrient-binding outer membrane lipoprotein [Flavobacterium foetidum]|uniref:SusD/RagB family nutrient-binding outer membrane lipoprotein n=1 Tax=Flavobacterium foetidum TaxID=2026681 RepID=UPI0010755C9F|nr:SusD/RagB family nutrient-binding outer membrane lipoprotein [Flavobacterium foetidum]KAF2514176.1 SusD/RagB family nutrient-binding outer membrane lipoprotein [Flavobacterium foetidum]
MKNIVSIIVLSLLMASCVSDDPTGNEDKDRSYGVPAETLFTNAQKELTDQLTTPSVNLNIIRYFTQYWAATQYNTEARFNITTRNIANFHWNALYRSVLGNLQTAKEVIATEIKPDLMSADEWAKQQKNKEALIEILQVYAFQVLVDSFGDVPYTDALRVKEVVLPKYDDDAVIYPKLIVRLDAAIANLNESSGSFGKADFIYGGDVSKWKIFANTLKLKIGLNLADVDASLSKATVESAYKAGVILNNSQNAIFAYPGASPMYNPIYANLVASNRNDFVASVTIVNDMNTLKDPRRAAYFTTIDGVYKGGLNGPTNLYQNFSHISDKIKEANFPGVIAEATESNFYLAEAAARGYVVGNNAEFYYNNAIKASFENWGIAAEADAYLESPDVKYSTAPGNNYKEKIGRQAWIAFFNRPMESWNSYRRLDFPVLVAPANAVAAAEGQIPKRYTYPINEQTVNNANWAAASAAIGGNKLKTHVFWDKN